MHANFIRSTLFTTLFIYFGAVASCAEPSEGRWYKGNLHTHSLWSDGNDFPEMICDWYKTHGLSFLGAVGSQYPQSWREVGLVRAACQTRSHRGTPPLPGSIR